MWWAVETLTTVGYGDMVPTTVVGKIMGGVVTVVGVAAVVLFTSVITISFLDQLRQRRAALRQVVGARLAQGPLSLRIPTISLGHSEIMSPAVPR
jgi:voltage-gated potassium channel